jgi:lysophospholipase L1-like esterase
MIDLLEPLKRIILLLPLLLIQGCGSGIHNEVVFIGDSVTEVWGAQAAFREHKNWTNKGISSQTSGAIAARFESDVISRHPDTVHIIAGTNDIYPGWELCGGDQNTCEHMRSMVEMAKHNGIKVVIGTIPPWGCYDDSICGASVADETAARYDRITQLNTWLKTFAIEEGVTLVDYHAALTNTTGLHYAEGRTSDGVHPSLAGYAAMQPFAESAISQPQQHR